MKKFTIEQKAEAYDNLIERLKDFRFEYRFSAFSDTIERYFPELNGSEDVKMKNFISNELACLRATDEKGTVRYNELTEAIAWIEKQNSNVDNANKEYWKGYREGKQEILDKYAEFEKQGEHQKFIDAIQIGDKVTRNKNGVLVNLSQLKRVAKHTDEVKPKFKVGDWVTDGVSKCQIRFIDDTQYWYSENCCILGNIESIDKRYRLWTIQDAKDGDVLATELIDGYPSPFIAIYKERGLDFFNSHCFVSRDGEFHEGTTGHDINLVYPATKEQRDTLMKAMADARYEWDAEKLELKKAEQKPTWSEEDEEMWLDAIKYLELFDAQGIHGNKAVPCINWLKSLKDRVQLQLKQEWSEEDERIYKSIIYSFAHNYPLTIQQQEFVKSLKPQKHWKPTEKQLKSLEIACDRNDIVGYRLTQILKELKKLKGE